MLLIAPAYSNFACNAARKDESYQTSPESAPVKGKGIVLCSCEENVTLRFSSCGHSVHSYNLQTNYTTIKGVTCRRTNFIRMMRDADRPNTMTPTSRVCSNFR